MRGPYDEKDITAEEIRNLIRAGAHKKWKAEGKPEGKAQEHWLAAQQEVLGEVDRSGATSPADPVAREPSSHHPKKRQEDLVAEAIEESFPASDPISPKRIT